MRFLLRKLKKYRIHFIFLIIFVVLQIITQVIITGYVSKTVSYTINALTDSVDYSDLSSQLFSKSVFLVIVAIIMAVFSVLSGFVSAKMSAGVGRDIRSDFFKKVMSFSSRETDKFSISTLISRCTADITQVQSTLYLLFSMALLAPVIVIVGIIAILQYAADMAIPVGILVALMLASFAVIMIKVGPFITKMNVRLDKMNGSFREFLTGTSVVRAFGMEKWMSNRTKKASKDYMDMALPSTRYLQILMSLFNFANNIVAVIVVWIGAYKVSEGVMEVGVMMAVVSYAQMILTGFTLLSAVSMQLPRTLVSLKRIEEVMNTDSCIVNGDVPYSALNKSEGIRFQNVSFKYFEDGGNVLDDISFTAKCGEVTAIIGATGSGKSTILKLISRMYDASQGTVNVLGEDVRKLDLNEYRKHLGYVSQGSHLFSGSIADNIEFGASKLDPEEIKEAALIAQASEFISKKESGFDEFVSEGGSNLSGGQRQRIAIARAISKKPDVFIFDDSFSALDMKTDAELRAALSEKIKDSITIIVAQRVSSIIHADQIIVLENGKIVGMGTHNELINSCITYREIAESQKQQR